MNGPKAAPPAAASASAPIKATPSTPSARSALTIDVRYGYLSASPIRDNATVNNLTAAVRNQFRGIAGFSGTAFFNNANTTRAQLLRPYPHFGALDAGLPAGSAWYHAMTAASNAGFLLLAYFTWSKSMDAIQYLNPTGMVPAHTISGLDRTRRFTLAVMYEIPLFKNNRYLGGWQARVLYQDTTELGH